MKRTFCFVAALLCMWLGCSGTHAQTGGSGGIGPPGQLVPTFQELLWLDAFGLDFQIGEDFMLMGPTENGEADVGAVWFDDTPGMHVASGTMEELFYAPVLAEPPVVSNHVTSFGGEIQAYTLTVELKAVAGVLVGTTGQELIVSGLTYEYSMDFSLPALEDPIEFRIVVPLWRHTDAPSAVLWAERLSDPATALRAAEPGYCADRHDLCVDDAYADYQGALDDCFDIDWGAVQGGGGLAGVIGGGIGGLVGLVGGPGGVAVGIGVGGAIGGALGGTASQIYNELDCRHDAYDQYFRDADACWARYQFCQDHGEWPQ